MLIGRWRPRLDTSAFAEWNRREFNSLVDHSAKVALDCRKDWCVIDEAALRVAKERKACIRLCSDGAKRGNGDSAAGMAVVAYFQDGSSKVLRRSGKSLGKLSSAFVAEAVSLEWCLDVFVDWYG